MASSLKRRPPHYNSDKRVSLSIYSINFVTKLRVILSKMFETIARPFVAAQRASIDFQDSEDEHLLQNTETKPAIKSKPFPVSLCLILAILNAILSLTLAILTWRSWFANTCTPCDCSERALSTYCKCNPLLVARNPLRNGKLTYLSTIIQSRQYSDVQPAFQ